MLVLSFGSDSGCPLCYKWSHENARNSEANSQTPTAKSIANQNFSMATRGPDICSSPCSIHVGLWASNRTEFRVKLRVPGKTPNAIIRLYKFQSYTSGVLMYSLAFISWMISPFSWSGGHITEFWTRQNYFVTFNCKYVTIYAIIIIIYPLLVKQDLLLKHWFCLRLIVAHKLKISYRL